MFPCRKPDQYHTGNKDKIGYPLASSGKIPPASRLWGIRNAANRESWARHYIDDTSTTALDLIDSALLTIGRGK
jgi:hypothetical protein